MKSYQVHIACYRSTIDVQRTECKHADYAWGGIHVRGRILSLLTMHTPDTIVQARYQTRINPGSFRRLCHPEFVHFKHLFPKLTMALFIKALDIMIEVDVMSKGTRRLGAMLHPRSKDILAYKQLRYETGNDWRKWEEQAMQYAKEWADSIPLGTFANTMQEISITRNDLSISDLFEAAARKLRVHLDKFIPVAEMLFDLQYTGKELAESLPLAVAYFNENPQ